MLISTWGSTFGLSCIRMMVYYFSSMWSSFCREICNRRLKSVSLRGFCLTRADIWLWHSWRLCVDIKLSLFILFRPSSVNYTVHCWVLSSKLNWKELFPVPSKSSWANTGTQVQSLPVYLWRRVDHDWRLCCRDKVHFLFVLKTQGAEADQTTFPTIPLFKEFMSRKDLMCTLPVIVML